jgi:hypothetical protein
MPGLPGSGGDPTCHYRLLGDGGEYQRLYRWGETVFEAYNFQVNDDQFGWDGTFRGELMNNSVFVYYVVVTFKNGTTAEFKGDVTLMR